MALGEISYAFFPSYGKFVKQLVELPDPGSNSFPSPERAVEGLDELVRQTANRCQPSFVLIPSIALSLFRVWSMLASCCGA